VKERCSGRHQCGPGAVPPLLQHLPLLWPSATYTFRHARVHCPFSIPDTGRHSPEEEHSAGVGDDDAGGLFDDKIRVVGTGHCVAEFQKNVGISAFFRKKLWK
jgi:hypothetical protein